MVSKKAKRLKAKRRKRVPDVFPFIAFRPGWTLGTDIPHAANDLGLSVPELLRRAVGYYLYRASIPEFLAVQSARKRSSNDAEETRKR